jgi:hypothetical protein
MQGYERYVINLVQTTYAPFEWDLCLRARIRRGKIIYLIANTLGYLRYTDITNIQGRSFEELARDAFIYFQESTNKHKPFKCAHCKYSVICSGVWWRYYRLFGDEELIPVRGKKILKPYQFLEEN